MLKATSMSGGVIGLARNIISRLILCQVRYLSRREKTEEVFLGAHRQILTIFKIQRILHQTTLTSRLTVLMQN